MYETLAGQAAVAFENARAYRIVQDLNRTLEARVKDRTARLAQALDETRRAQNRLVRSESLAAIGQLVAGVAHELNNPLTTVKSLLQSIDESLVESGEDLDLLRDDLAFVNRELGRAQGIVSSLLSLSRQTQTYREAVDMNAVVADALRIIHSQKPNASVVFNERMESSLPAIHGNFAHLGQVVLNVVQNAVQAVDPELGLIDLETRIRHDSNEVVFECRDNGPGIPDAIRQDIFKPFFTTKPVGSGTGLGLYICHEIVTRHGGRIHIANNAPGVCVTVSLPKASPSASS